MSNADLGKKVEDLSPLDAVGRFLPDETRTVLLKEYPYVQNPQNQWDEIKNQEFLGALRQYKGEFLRTPEGTIWFNANLPESIHEESKHEHLHFGHKPGSGSGIGHGPYNQ